MGEKFRFLHFADSHNGYNGNSSKHNEFSALRIDKTVNGINVRQLDIDKAFEQVMDIAIEQKVDAVVHAGDGWDSWGYKDPYVNNFYMDQVSRLYPENIPYIEIVGNHNLPKKIGKGCHLKSLGKLPGVTTVYQGFYERHGLPDHDVVFHCVPSTFTQEILDESLAEVQRENGKINIGVGHFGVTSIKHYAENAINSLVVDLDRLVACEMDYFALGDYHVPTDFGHNIRYSGPIERLGFGEIKTEPQVLIVEIDKDTHEVDVTPIPLKVRDMIEIPPIDSQGMSIEQVNEEIRSRLEKWNIEDKIVRFRVSHLSPEFKRLIDVDTIKEMTASALHFKIEFVNRLDKIKEARTGETQFVGVLAGWNDFVETIENDGTYDKEELKKIGYDKLLEVQDDASI